MASLVVAGDVSGSVTLSAPSAAGSTVITLPTTSGTMVVTGGAQTVQFAAGSAASPSITFTGDTNTGIFSPAADVIAFSTNGTEDARFDSAGNFGIGTTSPAGRLHVVGTSDQIRCGNGTNTAFLGASGSSGYTGTLTNDPFLFYTNSAERMRISSGGDVGIGTSPNFRLDVARGSSGVVMNLQGTDAYDAETGILFSSQRAKISGFLNSGGAIPGTSLRFYTMPDSGSVTERMRIGSDGKVFVGTSTSQNNGRVNILTTPGTDTGLYFYPTSNTTYNPIGFFNNGTQVGYIQCSTSATTYSTSSDYRLKENIEPMVGALAKVAQLKPCTYTWKSTGESGQGFIAHELQAVVPDCVTGQKDAVDEDGNPVYQGVDTSFLVATLTAAIQELNAKVEAQAAEIAALKGAN